MIKKHQTVIRHTENHGVIICVAYLYISEISKPKIQNLRSIPQSFTYKITLVTLQAVGNTITILVTVMELAD